MTATFTGALLLPRRPSLSDSLDSDNDTDIDSVDADLLDTDYRLPLSNQQFPQQNSQRSPSLAPGTSRTQPRSDVRRAVRPFKEVQAEKYHFDEFWDHFSRKKRKKPDSLVLDKHVDRAMDGRSGLYNARAYEIPRHRHSLVDSLRHGWRNNSYHNLDSGWSNPTDPAPSWTQVLSAPRIRRWILIFLVSISLSWLYWERYGQDAWTERTTLNNAVNDRMNSNLGFFGTNKLPQFIDMTQVKTLDTHFIPGATGSKRLIFVGDVHGCHEECKFLLSPYRFARRDESIGQRPPTRSVPWLITGYSSRFLTLQAIF